MPSAVKKVKLLRRRLRYLNDEINAGNTGYRIAEAEALAWALDYLEPIAEVEQSDVAMGGRHAAWKRCVVALFGEDAAARCKDWIAQDRLSRTPPQRMNDGMD